jgi:hypothetical protein
VAVGATSARLTVKRLPRPWGDFLRSYKVFVDGTLVGMIRRRQTRSFDVVPGHHQIHLEIDWCRSRRIDVEFGPGQEVYMTCRCRNSSRLGFMAPDGYIRLEIADGTPEAAASSA